MVVTLSDSLFERVLVPVASETDARIANEEILPALEATGGVAVVVHVVKEASDGVSPSPPSFQAADAEQLFAVARDGHESLVESTRTAYGTDIAESLFDVAEAVDASLIVFSPRQKNRLIRLLTGDTALSLVTEPEVPVLSVPQRTE